MDEISIAGQTCGSTYNAAYVRRCQPRAALPHTPGDVAPEIACALIVSPLQKLSRREPSSPF